MRKCFVAAALVALLVSQLAMASSGDKPKEEKKAQVEVRTGAMGFGKVVTIGPDGKVDIQDLGGQLPKDVLDKLPKEMQDAIQKAAPKGQPGAIWSGKMKVTIDQNGKRQDFEWDLNGTGAPQALPLPNPGEVLKKHGANLPPEARQALEAAEQAAKKAEQAAKKARESHRQAAGGHVKDAGDLNAKLDKILERLERLEKDVKEFKTKKDR